MRSTRSDAVVLIVPAAATIVLDLIVAVEIGIAVAAGLALRSVARTPSATPEPVPELDRATSDELLDSGILSYRLDGALFFGAAQRFLTELTAVTEVGSAAWRERVCQYG